VLSVCAFAYVFGSFTVVPTIINPTKKSVKVVTLLTYLHRVPVQILARILAILTELFCAFATQLHD
jgi:hypothetical protein